jgi:hypothetical protein
MGAGGRYLIIITLMTKKSWKFLCMPLILDVSVKNYHSSRCNGHGLKRKDTKYGIRQLHGEDIRRCL